MAGGGARRGREALEPRPTRPLIALCPSRAMHPVAVPCARTTVVEPLRYCDDRPLPPKEELLRRLEGRAGLDAQLEVLRLLCPCRNTFRDREVWGYMIRVYKTHHIGEVREGAHHAVMSLRERARIDTQTAALLHEINAGAGQRRHRWLWTGGPVEHPKPVRNDVPTIIEMLASADPVEHEDALRALFRSDRHRVAGAVWREVERAGRSNDPRLRAKATTAIRRIEKRRAAAASPRGGSLPSRLGSATA